jgi:hypothetical protein
MSDWEIAVVIVTAVIGIAGIIAEKTETPTDNRIVAIIQKMWGIITFGKRMK